MSTLVTKNLQIGADGTASNNFTVYQPVSPDGTLRIGNGNSGTTSAQVVLTSAGNVGIGTASPTARLHVNVPSGGVQIRATSTTDVSFAAVASAADSTAFMTVINDARQWTMRVNGAASDQFQIRDSTASADRLVIDSTGRVTMPFQPAFNAHVGPGTQTSGVLVFSTVRVNTGSHYNTSTGTFTAPVAGIYVFAWQAYKNSGTTAATSIEFQKNGAPIYEGLAATTVDFISIEGSVVINMAANDTARLTVRQGTIHTNNSFSFFSGTLIG